MQLERRLGRMSGASACDANNCDTCGWDECSCTSGCDWNKRAGELTDGV